MTSRVTRVNGELGHSFQFAVPQAIDSSCWHFRVLWTTLVVKGVFSIVEPPEGSRNRLISHVVGPLPGALIRPVRPLCGARTIFIVHRAWGGDSFYRNPLWMLKSHDFDPIRKLPGQFLYCRKSFCSKFYCTCWPSVPHEGNKSSLPMGRR